MDARWSLDGSLGKFHASEPNALSGCIDLANVPLGCSSLKLADQNIGGAILAFAEAPFLDELAGTPPNDLFIRGGDLVAVFERSTHRPLRLQFQWSILAAEPDQVLFGGLELTLSVQTDQLDSLPQFAVRSTLPNASIEQHCFADDETAPFADSVTAITHLLRTGCYVEFTNPRFGVESSVDPEGAFHRLFQRRLEKGVILRSRIGGLFLSDANPSQIERLARRIADEPLPLTA